MDHNKGRPMIGRNGSPHDWAVWDALPQPIRHTLAHADYKWSAASAAQQLRKSSIQAVVVLIKTMDAKAWARECERIEGEIELREMGIKI